MRVCFLGVLDDGNPRQQALIEGAAAVGIEVIRAPLPAELPMASRAPMVFRHLSSTARHADAVLILEGMGVLAPAARLRAMTVHRKAVFDASVSLFEQAVEEEERFKPRSPQALGLRRMDDLNERLYPTITDTAEHANRIEARSGKRPQLIPTGVTSDWLNVPVADSAPGPLRVCFFGGFSPVYGLANVLRAISRLGGDTRFSFELIGEGTQREETIERAKALILPNVTFPRVVDNLPGHVAAADICLGMFGQREKTVYTLPASVIQAMALGKVVITSESPAVREYFTPGEHLLTVEPSNPSAVADALRIVADDPARREAMGMAARAVVHSRLTARHTGEALLHVLETL